MEGLDRLINLAETNEIVILEKDGTTQKITGLVRLLKDLKTKIDKDELLEQFIKWYKENK